MKCKSCADLSLVSADVFTLVRLGPGLELKEIQKELDGLGLELNKEIQKELEESNLQQSPDKVFEL